jgi:hypothetical protein
MRNQAKLQLQQLLPQLDLVQLAHDQWLHAEHDLHELLEHQHLLEQRLELQQQELHVHRFVVHLLKEMETQLVAHHDVEAQEVHDVQHLKTDVQSSNKKFSLFAVLFVSSQEDAVCHSLYL